MVIIPTQCVEDRDRKNRLSSTGFRRDHVRLDEFMPDHCVKFR